jgi:hypothetical protein
MRNLVVSFPNESHSVERDEKRVLGVTTTLRQSLLAMLNTPKAGVARLLPLRGLVEWQSNNTSAGSEQTFRLFMYLCAEVAITHQTANYMSAV